MLRNITREKEHLVGQMSRDLARIVQMTHPKDMEDAVKQAYRMFVKGEKSKTRRSSSSSTRALVVSSSENTSESLAESSRHIGQLNKSIKTLQDTLALQKRESEFFRRKSIDQNSCLTNECNALRRESHQEKVRAEGYLMQLKQQQAGTSVPENTSTGVQSLNTTTNKGRMVHHQKSPKQKLVQPSHIKPTFGKHNLASKLLVPINQCSTSGRPNTVQQHGRVITGNTKSFAKGSHLRGLSAAVANVTDRYNTQLRHQKNEIHQLKGQLNWLLQEQAGLQQGETSE